jgi:pilus assembly protein FimV
MQLKSSVLAVALAALPLGADAAGLGKITVLSSLGQPLRAEVEITANSEEMISLSARIAPAEVFRKSGVEYSVALSSIRFSVEKRPDGQPFLSMRSDHPVSDPFLDMLVELNWASGRLVREYTFLLDPPESLLKPAAQAAPISLPAVQVPEAKVEPAPVSRPVAAPVSPSPAPASAEKPVAPPAEEQAQKKPAPDMRVVRGADGVQRIVKAEPAKNEEMHTVKRGETLNRIASATKPDGVNLDQMLIALFRSNKDAFDGGNINRLKAGKILTLPDRDTVAAIDADEARQIVVAQSADFNAYRRKLAAATLAAPMPNEEAPKQSVTGKIAPKVEEKLPPAAHGKDKLEISRADSAAAKTAEGRRAAAEEELLARNKALKEANARIAELDKNLGDMKKLAELKNQNMAELQKQAQVAKATPAPAPAPAAPPLIVPEIKKPEAKQPAPAPVPAVQPPLTPAAQQPEKPAEQPAPAAVAQTKAPEEKPAQPATPAEAAATAQPGAKKPLPPPPPPPPPPSFIDDNPEIVFGGGGVLALLLGYLGFSFWRKKRAAATQEAFGPSSQAEPSINSVFGSTGGQVVDTGSTSSSMQTDFSLAEVGGNESGEGVDPIKEADVYMAYGRNAQAEEILLDALKTEPERQEIHLKLLEIYAARKSNKQFESIATDLKKLTGGSGPNWEKAQQLGHDIDPDNTLYASGKAGEEAPYDPAATMVLSPQELGNLAKKLPPESAGEMEAAQATMIQPAPELPAAEAEEEFPDSLDFELDLGSPSLPDVSTAPGEAGKMEAAGAGLDFEFDLGEPAATPATPSATTKPVESASAVDFDFDLGSGESPVAPDANVLTLSVPAAKPAQEGNLIDFDLAAPAPSAADAEVGISKLEPAGAAEPAMDFALEIPGEAVKKAAAPSPAPSAMPVDLSSISLELDSGNKAAEAPFKIPEIPSAVDAGSQEVETKLELAQAYEEMGDKEGARELLQEVLNEGNASQKAAARSKLDKLV